MYANNFKSTSFVLRFVIVSQKDFNANLDFEIFLDSNKFSAMYYDLTKAEKKVARVCIDKGLDAEFKEALEKVEMVTKKWRAGEFENNKAAYHEMYKTLDEKNDAIAKRYDHLGGSRWLMAISQIYRDGYITDEDIGKFHEDTKITLKRWAHKQ